MQRHTLAALIVANHLKYYVNFMSNGTIIKDITIFFISSQSYKISLKNQGKKWETKNILYNGS